MKVFEYYCADCLAALGHHRHGCASTRPLSEVEPGDVVIHNHKPWIVAEHTGTELELTRATGETMFVTFSNRDHPVSIDSNLERVGPFHF